MITKLSIKNLRPYLANPDFAEKIHIYDSLESTNKMAREMANNGCGHGSVIIADRQTAGKGRFGRNFYSPPENGLYLSIILCAEKLKPQDMTLVTLAAAVAVCRAVKTVTGKSADIKWVNDIFLNSKKICGILTEAEVDPISGHTDRIVVGIGINIDTADFPGDLSETAGSVFDGGTDGEARNRIAAELVNIFLSSTDWIGAPETLEEYKNRMILIGCVVTVCGSNGAFEATALDIDGIGRLIVKKADGSVVALSSGEVSIKI